MSLANFISLPVLSFYKLVSLFTNNPNRGSGASLLKNYHPYKCHIFPLAITSWVFSLKVTLAPVCTAALVIMVAIE